MYSLTLTPITYDYDDSDVSEAASSDDEEDGVPCTGDKDEGLDLTEEVAANAGAGAKKAATAAEAKTKTAKDLRAKAQGAASGSDPAKAADEADKEAAEAKRRAADLKQKAQLAKAGARGAGHSLPEDEYDAVFVSNGPGDPAMCGATVEGLRALSSSEDGVW